MAGLDLLAVDQRHRLGADVQRLGQCLTDTLDGPTGQARLESMHAVHNFHLADFFFARCRQGVRRRDLFELLRGHEHSLLPSKSRVVTGEAEKAGHPVIRVLAERGEKLFDPPRRSLAGLGMMRILGEHVNRQTASQTASAGRSSLVPERGSPVNHGGMNRPGLSQDDLFLALERGRWDIVLRTRWMQKTAVSLAAAWMGWYKGSRLDNGWRGT